MSQSVAAPSDTAKCRDCGQTVRWGETSTGKRAPYDSDGQLHFRTCPSPSQRSVPSRPAPAAQPTTSTPDRTAIRLAVLTAASQFCGAWGSTREEVKANHVLLIADKWLAWVEGGAAAD